MSSAVSARPPGGQHRDPELTPTKDQPKTGALVQVFTSGTMVQVFQLSGEVPSGSFKGGYETRSG